MNVCRLLCFFPFSVHDRVTDLGVLGDQMLIPQVVLNELIAVPVNIIGQSVQNPLQLLVPGGFQDPRS